MGDYKTIMLKDNSGKTLYKSRCDKIEIECLANTIKCNCKPNCKGCQDHRGLAMDLASVANDWAWFGDITVSGSVK